MMNSNLLERHKRRFGNSYKTILKRLLLVGTCIALPMIAWAQWTTSSNDIYSSNSGSVGIGTTTPYGKLHVNGLVKIEGSNVLEFNSGNEASGVGAVLGFDTTNNFFWIQSVHQGVSYLPMSLNPWGGNVGIGTTSPTARLTVKQANDSQTGGNAGLRIENTGGTTVTQLITGGDGGSYLFNGTGSNFLMISSAGNVGIGTYAPASKLDVVGDVTVSGNISAKYQDLAEWVPAEHAIAPGTVVIQDPESINSVIPSSESYDTRVAGVVSANPGIVLGVAGEGKVRVATTGRVKVHVDATRAPIRAGDLLVTSDRPGTAMRSEPIEFSGRRLHQPGTLIGKALEPLNEGEGEILVLLSLQ